MSNPNGQGNDQNAPEGENSEQQFVSRDDIAAIVNAAVTSQLKRSLNKVVGEQLDAAMAPLRARLEPTQTEQKPAGGASPEVAALQKQLSDMQAAMRAAQDEAESERRRGREQKAFSALKSELQGKVRPEALDVAAEYLFNARKKVSIDDDGNPLFTVRASRMKGMPEEDIQYPLADGVREFLKSKEAALFLPAPSGAQAQAARPAMQQRQAPRYDAPPMSEEEKAQRTLEALLAQGIELP